VGTTTMVLAIALDVMVVVAWISGRARAASGYAP
jgi:hypothetical protein